LVGSIAFEISFDGVGGESNPLVGMCWCCIILHNYNLLLYSLIIIGPSVAAKNRLAIDEGYKSIHKWNLLIVQTYQ
jgi:hypothetical protein